MRRQRGPALLIEAESLAPAPETQVDTRPFNPAWLLLALGLALAMLPARGLVAVLVERLALNFIITLVGAGLLAPVAEEFFFPGLIHRWFSARLGIWPAVFISSAIFAAGHADSNGVVASSFGLRLVLAGSPTAAARCGFPSRCTRPITAWR